MIKKIINRITLEALLMLSLLKNYKEACELARLSILSDENNKKYFAGVCPICAQNTLKCFARFPVNIPQGQDHSLLYFEYEKIDIKALKGKKEILDKTLGFFVSVTWSFCDNCHNGSLSPQITANHLMKYYVDFYKRGKKVDQLRRNTKELHGKYLSSLLLPHSTILEVGAADGITAEYLAQCGHEIFVFEPSEQFSKQLKQSMHITYTDNYSYLTGTLDAIYLHHVLEHIPEPIKYLTTLQPLLKDNGVIFIQVPDLSLQVGLLNKICRRSIYTLFNKPYINFKILNDEHLKRKAANWFDALANDHVNAFTSEGLEYVLSEGGYHVVSMIQSTEDRITYNNVNYAWPVDEETGSPPNGLTLVARKK